MVKALGCQSTGANVYLHPGNEYENLSEKILSEHGIRREGIIIGLAPGAAYGPAKRWLPERFAAVGDRLIEDLSAQVILFGSREDRQTTDLVEQHAHHPLINLAGKTNLKEAIAVYLQVQPFHIQRFRSDAYCRSFKYPHGCHFRIDESCHDLSCRRQKCSYLQRRLVQPMSQRDMPDRFQMHGHNQC